MFERDYLMRIIMELGSAIRRSLERGEREPDGDGDGDPGDAARMLDAAVGVATDLDGTALLSLAPESIATVMQVSGTDPAVTEYVCRSLLLAGRYYAQAGDAALGRLRTEQAMAVAAAYGHDLTEADGAPEAVEAFLDDAVEK